jgi:hypothetical protein
MSVTRDHPRDRLVGMLSAFATWVRRHSLWSSVLSLLVALAAIVQILNGMPDLIERDLPWLGNKVNAGAFVASIWQIAWAAPLLMALGLLVAIYRHSRVHPPWLGRHADASSTPVRLPGHTLVGFGRDWVRCSCGWTGSGPDSVLHQAGDPVASTNVPSDPPPMPDRNALASLADAAWAKLGESRGLSPSTPNADSLSRALRRWSNRWEIDVERALIGDVATLTAFRHNVDTSQMHYVESPALVLETKLRLLDSYLSPQVKGEMELQDQRETQHIEDAVSHDIAVSPTAAVEGDSDLKKRLREWRMHQLNETAAMLAETLDGYLAFIADPQPRMPATPSRPEANLALVGDRGAIVAYVRAVAAMSKYIPKTLGDATLGRVSDLL